MSNQSLRDIQSVKDWMNMPTCHANGITLTLNNALTVTYKIKMFMHVHAHRNATSCSQTYLRANAQKKLSCS